MKVAYFDCQFGAAGDMLLGSLLDAGLDEGTWLAEVKKIGLPEGSFSLSIESTVRCNLAGKKLTVRSGAPTCGRHLEEIAAIVDQSAIAPAAKSLSMKVFQRLAAAEGKVHGIPPQDVHFHELGAVDSIIDIVGFAIAFCLLGIESTWVSPLVTGSATVQMEHGVFPVPAPAVLNLIKLSGAPVKNSPIDFECLTPTAAAILTTLCDGWGTLPDLECITGIGYGAGTRDTRDWPNMTRVVLGESALTDHHCGEQLAWVVQANIDDATPQLLAFASDRLFEAGALDVTLTPAVMKKGRSGHVLSVLCNVFDRQAIEQLLLRETTTIGVRSHQVHRRVAARQDTTVKLPQGEVRVKIARDAGGNILNIQPEFVDCAQYALANKVPLKEVMAAAMSQAASRS